MKRQALYSSSRPQPGAASAAAALTDAAAPAAEAAAPSRPGWRIRARAAAARRRGSLLFLAGLLAAGLGASAYFYSRPDAEELTQDDVDAAVLHTLETRSLPSRPARAAEAVRQSVVRIRAYGDAPRDPRVARDREGAAPGAKPPAPGQGAPGTQGEPQRAERGAPGRGARPPALPPAKPAPPGAPAAPAVPDDEQEASVGSGVVVVDDGTILTSLHVVAGAKRIVVTFYDGSDSEATVAGVQPDNDLAVLKAKRLPDDLPAAMLGSSSRLAPGDEVVAVGFPFAIGPSVSSGVVSGLNREFLSPEGKRLLTHLIQFDAAANPGNSGGPLVTMDGEVVGIVAAILNPTAQRTFIGIGFAVTIENAGSAMGMSPF